MNERSADSARVSEEVVPDSEPERASPRFGPSRPLINFCLAPEVSATLLRASSRQIDKATLVVLRATDAPAFAAIHATNLLFQIGRRAAEVSFNGGAEGKLVLKTLIC